MYVLAINGSYREGGITDQALDAMSQTLSEAGATVEIIHLRDYPIAFCANCRACTQTPGDEPGECALGDAMQALIEKTEKADAYIFASPTNFFTVTALYKRFFERLVPYGYWPWGAPAPKYRKEVLTKKAVVLSSCAAPSLMGRVFYSSIKLLKLTAKTVGAKSVGSLMLGLIASEPAQKLSQKELEKAKKLALKLL